MIVKFLLQCGTLRLNIHLFMLQFQRFYFSSEWIKSDFRRSDKYLKNLIKGNEVKSEWVSYCQFNEKQISIFILTPNVQQITQIYQLYKHLISCYIPKQPNLFENYKLFKFIDICLMSTNLCHLVVYHFIKMSNSSWKFIRFDLFSMKFNEI